MTFEREASQFGVGGESAASRDEAVEIGERLEAKRACSIGSSAMALCSMPLGVQF